MEYRDEGRNGTGVLFITANYGDQLGIVYSSHSGWDRVDSLENIKKIGRCEEMPTVPTLWSDIEHIATAYFATAKSFTPAPDKSYAENQAAWVKFHGLKVGDQVKVVKKFEGDNGYVAWDYNPAKRALQGEVIEIREIKACAINTTDFSFPYFALEPVSK